MSIGPTQSLTRAGAIAGKADLTEFIGPSFMESDRAVWMQSDYTQQELEAQIEALPSLYGEAGTRTRQDAIDYAAGITAYIVKARSNPSLLPAEYAALGKTPADWTPGDSVAVAAEINQGFDLGGGSEVAD